MRKKDFNFILRKDNVFEFEKRLNRLLMVTECLKVQTYYKRKTNCNNILQSIGIKNNILNIMETVPSYLVNGKIQFDSYPSMINLYSKDCRGINIRIHKDCSFIIEFGQKIKFTPTEIILLNEPSKIFFKKNNQSSTETRITIFDNLELAKNNIDIDEQLATQYWENVENDLLNDLDDF